VKPKKSNQNAKQLARPQAYKSYETKLENPKASKMNLQKSKATNAANEVEGKRIASTPKTSYGIRKMRRKRYPKVNVRYRRSVYERSRNSEGRVRSGRATKRKRRMRRHTETKLEKRMRMTRLMKLNGTKKLKEPRRKTKGCGR
jgi:hypothetical protein